MANRYKVQFVGSDFELFLKDSLTGKPVPAIGILGGTKEEPRPILEGKGFAIQEDNVMAEMNIPPVASAKAFVKACNRALGYLYDFTAERDLVPEIVASQFFTPEQLDHPQAKTIGCEPDFCVWTQSVNEINKESDLLKKMRSAGAHIHISYLVDGLAPKLEHIEPMVKANDLFLGVPSVLLDGDKMRKKLYGKAGAFRPKSYGHEYRVLSNFWLRNDDLKEWAYEQAVRGADALNEGEIDFSNEEFSNKIVTCINESDKRIARALVRKYGLSVPNRVLSAS